MRPATKRSLFTAVGFALFTAWSVASALPLFPNTLLEDDNIDVMSFDANGNGRLDVGDRLTAVIDFVRIASIPPGASYDPSELTGYTEIQVISKVEIFPGFFRIDFGPTAAFQATYGVGAMIALFEDPADNLNLVTECLSVAGCLADATDGALWAVMGLYDADNQWFSLGSDDVAAASTLGAATKVATVNFALNVDPAQNNTGYTLADQAVPCIIGFSCAGDGMAQVIGSADILGGEGLAPGHVRSDTDATLRTVVPEPGTSALLGIALLAMGALQRRRNAA